LILLLADISQSTNRFIVSCPDVPLYDKLLSFGVIWLCLHWQPLVATGLIYSNTLKRAFHIW